MAEMNDKDGNRLLNNDRRPEDLPFYRVGATFGSPDDEHYYGLGQNQEGYLDHRGHKVECWADYQSAGGPNFCVPFLVTNKGYGLLWDNPSKTTILPGFNEQTKWISQVGQRVSFFVVAGATTDEIYAGYRLLTGDTPMLPKWAYGLIQCKQRYTTQEEMLSVAHGFRERHLPIDMLVLDWFYYTKMGQMDFIKEQWPDPADMNRQLHAMNIETMISVWPRFRPDSRFYDHIQKNGWFLHHADGTPEDGLPYDGQGSDIDTTIRMRRPGTGVWSAKTLRVQDSTLFGPMRPSPICLPTVATSRLDRERNTLMCIRSFIRLRSITVFGKTCRTHVRSSSQGMHTSEHSTTAQSSGRRISSPHGMC